MSSSSSSPSPPATAGNGLAKSGAIVSAAGVALFVAFVAVLLAFPVLKECRGGGADSDNGGKSDDDNNSNANCSFSSTAPEALQLLVTPQFLAVSLMVIAAGVLMVRLGRWRQNRKAGGKKGGAGGP